MMTEQTQLFDKPMSELREAFVRNRFGQRDVFDLLNVEEWFDRQRTAEQPHAEVWLGLLARDFMLMCAGTNPITHLRECATAVFRDGSALAVSPNYGLVYFRIRDGIYAGMHAPRIHVPAGTDQLYTLDEENGALVVRRIFETNPAMAARAVLDILHAEWDRRRPRWREARQFLCDALAEEIKRERTKAETDFDTAVAVSADGTKIIHADWVVVVDNDQSALLFPAVAFRDQKIIRVPRMERIGLAQSMLDGVHDVNAQSIAPTLTCLMWYAKFRHQNGLQFYGDQHVKLQDGPKLTTRLLITSSQFCPSPLPDGGVAVMVRKL